MDVIADRYEIGQTLGAGGMARVVQAYDRVLDRQVAIKLLREDISVDPSVRERFLGEAKTAARFNHPNAVTVFDTGQDGRQPWIVMELISGQDLAQRLGTSGRLDETQAVTIADAVLAALDAAHRDGMVHRDVKPGNIMLLDDGGVKLADFGIAKSIQDATAGLTATGQIIGTAKYLSPEQVDGNAATPASDVYALGCVLYEMLAGRPPFTGDSAIAIALAHTRDRAPDIRRVRPDVSPSVAAAIDRALVKDPAQRFANAGQMRAALRGDAVAAAYAPTALVADAATTQVLPAGAPAAQRSARRTPWGFIILIAAVLLAALILAMQAGDPPAEQPRQTRQPGAGVTEQPAEPTEQVEPSEQVEPTQAPTEAVESEPPVEGPPPPTDIPSLITLLSSTEEPTTFGAKQEDVLAGLEKVSGLEGEEQAHEADVLQEKIAEWVGKDEFDVHLGNLAIALLDPLAAQAAGDDGDEGKGNGKGKGNKDDD